MRKVNFNVSETGKGANQVFKVESFDDGIGITLPNGSKPMLSFSDPDFGSKLKGYRDLAKEQASANYEKIRQGAVVAFDNAIAEQEEAILALIDDVENQ